MMPLIIVGGNDLDAAHRPPGVPTFHAAQDINAIVRDYTKWDDTPASLQHYAQSMVRAYKIAMSEPRGPVYLTLPREWLCEALESTQLPAGALEPAVLGHFDFAKEPVKMSQLAAGALAFLRGDVRPVQVRRTQHHQFHALIAQLNRLVQSLSEGSAQKRHRHRRLHIGGGQHDGRFHFFKATAALAAAITCATDRP